MPKPLTDRDGEVRELTLAEMKRLRPIAEVDPGMAEAVEQLREQSIAASHTTRAVKTVPLENRRAKPLTEGKIVQAATGAGAKAANAKPTKIQDAKANIAKSRREKGPAGSGPTRARA